jgi:cell division transport system permease protein
MRFLTTIKRITRSGISEFLRSGIVTVSTVLVMTITLFTFGMLIFTNAAFVGTLTTIQEKIDINVYFFPEADKASIDAFQKQVRELPEVASVTFVSRDDALTSFKERHKDDQLILQAIDEIGGNPLGASLAIRAKDTSQYEAIGKSLEGGTLLKEGEKSIVERVNYSQNKAAIDRLTAIVRATERAGLFIALFLALASILIVFNTIRLGIYTAKDEIAVMRLVGASSWYARGPFIIQGMLYGITAGCITLLALLPLAYYLGPISESFFGTFNTYTYYLSHFGQFVLGVVVAGFFLGAISSYLAVRRYLSV